MKDKKAPFVVVPIWFATAAAKAAKAPAHLVIVHLLHTSWKAKGRAFTLANGWLEEQGVSRRTKNRVLRDLEAAGLITIERSNGQSPKVTIVVL